MRQSFEKESIQLSRRSFLLSSSALLSACTTFQPGGGGGPDVAALGDCHVHLFNAADLPVRGFFANVLAFQQLKNWPDFILFFVEILAVAMKRLAISATTEMNQMHSLIGVQADSTAQQFAAAVLAEADRAARLENPSLKELGPTRSVTASAEAFFSQLTSRTPLTGRSFASGAERQRIIAELAKVARHGADAVPANLDNGRGGLRQLWQLIRWAYLMTNSRSSHLHRYRREMRLGPQQPSVIVNLLVDYDEWLDDRPLPGSSTDEQVAFWAAMSAKVAADTSIHTFAGYDPLAHAISQLPGQSATYFERRKRWLGLSGTAGASPVIKGFKLYPPMGFSVVKNPPWPPNLQRSQRNAAERWKSLGGRLPDLPMALDQSLNEMIGFCMDHDVPILAHAYDSNSAFDGAGRFATPEQWLKRIATKGPVGSQRPLRLLLAHYDTLNADIVTMRALLDLDRQNRANVYFDVAYDEQVLADPSYAQSILGKIREICGPHSNDADRFTFGTDWIMLPQQIGYKHYVRIFDDAVRADTEFWEPRRDRFFGGNLRRFLNLA